MAITGFLSVPDIAGESQRIEHEGEIEVFGVRWDVEQSSTATLGRSRIRTRARAIRGPVVVHKYYDAASPYLADATNRGKYFDEVVLTLSSFGTEGPFDYLVLTMQNVTFSAYEFANETEDINDTLLRERIEIESDKITIKYTVQSDDHSAGDAHEVVLTH